MKNTIVLTCDGCGQDASPEHLARRLRRLEWTTRYRPVHINTLLLGWAAPREDRDFLYSPEGEFHGEAGLLLEAMGISAAGKSPEAVHAEIQRAGLFLTHVLECPIERGAEKSEELSSLLAKRLPAVEARIRRSLKPKRVVLTSGASQRIVTSVTAARVGCSVILDGAGPFALDGREPEKAVVRLREALAAGAMG
jgi:hypothetical protein